MTTESETSWGRKMLWYLVAGIMLLIIATLESPLLVVAWMTLSVLAVCIVYYPTETTSFAMETATDVSTGIVSTITGIDVVEIAHNLAPVVTFALLVGAFVGWYYKNLHRFDPDMHEELEELRDPSEGEATDVE